MIGCNIRNLVNKCERDEKSAINSDFKSPRLNNESAKALVAPEILSRKKKKIPILSLNSLRMKKFNGS